MIAKLTYATLHEKFRQEDNRLIADALRQRAAASEQPAEVSDEDSTSEQLDQDEAT